MTFTKDFAKLEAVDYVHNERVAIEMPTTSNVLQYFTEEGTKLSIRPSGTEPKIKFYIEVRSSAKSLEELDQAENEDNSKFNSIRQELGI